MSPSATDDDYAYVVGIDFGTTYSGCCYAFNNDTMEDFQDITVW
jgi:molecular chaperone DnaK (HSP70)